jgi:integrase
MFMDIATKPDTTGITTCRNLKSGSKVAAKNTSHQNTSKTSAWAGRWTNLASDHSKRWEKRLYTPKSGGVQIGKLAVRIQHLGEREEFRFNITNRRAAAVQALDVFRFLKANGWKATRAKFKPDAEGQPKLDVTVGDYLAAVDGTRRLRTRTFDNYRRCLRTVIAESFRIRPKKGESKYDYRTGGHAAWTQRIDEIRLERLTPDVLKRWKRERIASMGHAPAALASARRTVNSYIRCARSLFTPAVVREIGSLKLPMPLPFHGVELEESGSQKYISRINVQSLIAAAKNELKSADAEAYKVFLLGLFSGMRKAEIDAAEWRMLDFDANVIRLEETEWLHLKTRDSAADITVDAEVMRELRALMPAPTTKRAPWSQFILQSQHAPQPDSLRPYYRAEETFDRLNTWLRAKGIRANKPLHELRKEVGAVIATEQGIYAASKFLRHSDITTTARHYADQKARINVGLGKFLDTMPKPAVAA